MDDYEQMLKKAQEELPENISKGERFVIEKVKGHLEGKKTILVKYLLRELATPGKIIRDRTILGTKVSAGKINKKIKKYASEFVFCSECSKPDTELTEEKEITYLKCLACGTKKPVKSLR